MPIIVCNVVLVKAQSDQHNTLQRDARCFSLVINRESSMLMITRCKIFSYESYIFFFSFFFSIIDVRQCHCRILTSLPLNECITVASQISRAASECSVVALHPIVTLVCALLTFKDVESYQEVDLISGSQLQRLWAMHAAQLLLHV